jgi:SPP1 family predicted phage head-tail adaptor
MGIFSYTPLDREITFVRALPSSDFDGAGSETTENVATVRANIEDVLPSRGEQMAQVVNIASRPARIRIRYRDDITANMRVIYGARTMEIVAGPAEIGRREGLELMVVEYSTRGNAA